VLRVTPDVASVLEETGLAIALQLLLMSLIQPLEHAVLILQTPARRLHPRIVCLRIQMLVQTASQRRLAQDPRACRQWLAPHVAVRVQELSHSRLHVWR
jgi:hypothetical protein